MIIKKPQKLGTKIDAGDKDRFVPTAETCIIMPGILVDRRCQGLRYVMLPIVRSWLCSDCDTALEDREGKAGDFEA